MKTGTCAFGEIATVGLGFKSLQNQFFYLTKQQIQQYGVEKEFLKPIFKLADLSNSEYLQKPKASQWLFYCNENEKDLGGTGALKYIRAMKDMRATERKQSSGKQHTIAEVLKAQSGGLWYGPKAIPHAAHTWLRKAFNTNFSPFIFEKAAALDQRCNFVRPKGDLDWKLVAAVVTSSLFALSVESYGSAAMGAGALELATKKLPEIRVPDIRNLSAAEKDQVVSLVDSVWKEQSPVEWTTEKQAIKALQELDTFLLALVGAEIPLIQIYADINDVVRSRIFVARDKEQTTKSHQRVDIAAVARSIAESVQTMLDSKRFPDDFYDGGSPGIVFDFTNSKSLEVECAPMLGEAVVDVRNGVSDEVLLSEQYPTPVAQVIVRALLLGRRRFVVPNDAATAEEALANFDKWLPTILERVEDSAKMSSLGTRYEQQVLTACFRALKLDVRATAPQFFGQARLQ
jgi:enamine deaminase RidA (YjgF/YER057c/UK114 family)